MESRRQGSTINKDQDRVHAVIEGIEFTLFYDYDELRDRKLYKISDMGRIEWFERRMNAIFLEPLRRIFDRNARAYKELCSNEEKYEPVRTIMIAAFSVLLNGVESLGSFLPLTKIPNDKGKPKARSKKTCFEAFMKRMPKPWPKITDRLWNDFRNGIAHQFAIMNGGIEFSEDRSATYWYDTYDGYKILKVEPIHFFNDFQHTARAVFNEVRKDPKTRKLFLGRFEEAYPKRR